MVSRSLGIETGGAVGIPLFFAQAIGRVVRARTAQESATVFLPAVRPLLALAATLEEAGHRVSPILMDLERDLTAEDVARRVARYAEALGVHDQFVRIARRYAQGAFGLAWLDLHRSGFAEHWEAALELDPDFVRPRLVWSGALLKVPPGQPVHSWLVSTSPAVASGLRMVWSMYLARSTGTSSASP